MVRFQLSGILGVVLVLGGMSLGSTAHAFQLSATPSSSSEGGGASKSAASTKFVSKTSTPASSKTTVGPVQAYSAAPSNTGGSGYSAGSGYAVAPSQDQSIVVQPVSKTNAMSFSATVTKDQSKTSGLKKSVLSTKNSKTSQVAEDKKVVNNNVLRGFQMDPAQ